jgi:hypothetical protein
MEGFMDFLSTLKINDDHIRTLTKGSDFLILNSLRLLDRSYPMLQSYSQVNLFLDNDAAAKDTKGCGSPWLLYVFCSWGSVLRLYT